MSWNTEYRVYPDREEAWIRWNRWTVLIFAENVGQHAKLQERVAKYIALEDRIEEEANVL